MSWNKFVFFLVLNFTSLQQVWACSFEVKNDIKFGTYDPLSKKANASMGQLQVKCPEKSPPPFSITLESGMAGKFTERTMTNGKYKLKYNLYLNPSYQTIWGNGTSNTGLVSALGENCVEGCQFNMYGLMPARQKSVGAGAYVDTITANINF